MVHRRPNAGKSTLLNSLLGQKLSIVSPKAQTTRHRILGILSEDKYQMILLDTPGVIRDQRNKLEQRMMRAVKMAIRDADALLAIIDASDRPEEALEMVQASGSAGDLIRMGHCPIESDAPAPQPGDTTKLPPMGVILNKMDLLTPEERADVTDYFTRVCKAERVFETSAINGIVSRAQRCQLWPPCSRNPLTRPRSNRRASMRSRSGQPESCPCPEAYTRRRSWPTSPSVSS